MADIDVRADVDVLEALEFEPECAGTGHALEINGHVAEQPATWSLFRPCGAVALVCDGWAKAHFSGQFDAFYCSPCGATHLSIECRFIPIGTP